MTYFEESCAVVERPREDVDQPDNFWNLDEPIVAVDPESGLRRVVKGGMMSYQREWWESEEFVKLLVGGYGCGKTLVMAKRLIGLALTNAPCPVACVSPTYPLARQTIITTLVELLMGKQSLLGRDFWWRFNKSTHEFHIRYRGRQATILIYSGDNPLSLRGPNLAAAGIDEPFIQDEDVFKQMIARVRHPDAVQLEILLTGTPEQLNWGYELAEGDWQERIPIAVVPASSRLNKVLDPDYITRLEGAFPGKAGQAYIDGKFINLSEGTVYYGFDRAKHVQELALPDGCMLGAGMDFNVDPMSAAVFWRAGNHIHFFDEIELPSADTEYMCDSLYDLYVKPRATKGRSTLDTIYPDATGSARKTSAPGGKTDFYYIRQAGFEIDAPHANPKRRDRYNAVNAMFKVNADGSTNMTISPKCKKLIKYLSLYTHELMNKTEQKAMSHLLDAFSYPVSRIFPVDRAALRKTTKLIGF